MKRDNVYEYIIDKNISINQCHDFNKRNRFQLAVSFMCLWDEKNIIITKYI